MLLDIDTAAGAAPGLATDGTSNQVSSATTTDTGAGTAAAPAPAYVNAALTWAVGISKVSEARLFSLGLEWSVDRGLQARLPLSALKRAILDRQPRAGLVHHSDRGVQ
jgi:hypothetical protein